MSGVFEPAMLPLEEKERLCRGLLDEFGIRVASFAKHRDELIIPCTITARHQHQDREPTAALNISKLTYKCLGCGASGGLLWFIAQHRGVSSVEARDWLGKETGTGGHLMELAALLRYFDALYADKPERRPIPTYSPRILEPWSGIHPWVTDPPEYDANGVNQGGRGIPFETAAAYQVGYAYDYPYTEHTTSERIVIPHFWRDRLVGWQTRRLNAADGTAKYKSSVEFPKDVTIYNYAPEQHDTAVVVEAPMSALRHIHHLHVVATFGADITSTQIKLLGRYKRVIFWLDNDQAGWEKYLDRVDSRGRVEKIGVLEQVAAYTDVWAVDSPYHADPGEIDDRRAEELVDGAISWVVWRPPPRLICPRCLATAHSGGCG